MSSFDHAKRFSKTHLLLAVASIGFCLGGAASAQTTTAECPGLPDAGRLRSVLQQVVKQGSSKNGGMGNQEWAARCQSGWHRLRHSIQRHNPQ